MHKLVPRLALVAAAVSGILIASQSASSAAPLTGRTAVAAVASTAPHTATSVTPASTVKVTSSGYAKGPAGKKSFYVIGTTHVGVNCGIITCTATFSNNASDTYWKGSKPKNAKQIKASMKWWITGINIHPSLPPGISFSLSGSAVLYHPGTVKNTRHVALRYQAGIGIKANIITGEDFTAQGDIQIGSSFYHVQGN